MNAMDARMAFIFPEPEPEPAPAPRPALVDPGPERDHKLHGAVPFSTNTELRVTSQPATKNHEARLVARLWCRRDDGSWWPIRLAPGISIASRNVRAFSVAVAAACAALEAERAV